MSSCYELKPMSAPGGRIKDNVIRHKDDSPYTDDTPLVQVMSPEDFTALDFKGGSPDELIEELLLSDVNYVDVYPTFLIGSFAIPDKIRVIGDPDMFAFYMDDLNLIFIDKDSLAQQILDTIAADDDFDTYTIPHCLYEFIRQLTINDMIFLGKLEDTMESFEEELLRPQILVNPRMIMRFRRKSMQLGIYYQQIATMCSIIEDNENAIMSEAEAHTYAHVVNLTDRLSMRADTLKEYGLQLYELQQSRIELKQNSIMQIFTIITVLFAPMTLITGWFGMNLQVLPGIEIPFMWICLIGFMVICTIVLLLVFRKKDWL